MAVDLQPYKIGTGDQNYPVKYDAALDHIQGEINSGLNQITANLNTLSAQITSEIDTAAGALSTQITGELNAAVGVVEGYRDQALTSATTATTQAGIATTKANQTVATASLAEGYKDSSLANAQAAAGAVASIGDVAARVMPILKARGITDIKAIAFKSAEGWEKQGNQSYKSQVRPAGRSLGDYSSATAAWAADKDGVASVAGDYYWNTSSDRQEELTTENNSVEGSRFGSAHMPLECLIVASEDSTVTRVFIFDLTDPLLPLWMMTTTVGSDSFIGHGYNNIGNVSIDWLSYKDGILLVGPKREASNAGFRVIDFKHDKAYWCRQSVYKISSLGASCFNQIDAEWKTLPNVDFQTSCAHQAFIEVIDGQPYIGYCGNISSGAGDGIGVWKYGTDTVYKNVTERRAIAALNKRMYAITGDSPATLVDFGQIDELNIAGFGGVNQWNAVTTPSLTANAYNFQGLLAANNSLLLLHADGFDQLWPNLADKESSLIARHGLNYATPPMKKSELMLICGTDEGTVGSVTPNVYLAASTTSFIYTPNSVASQITGSIDIRVHIKPLSWAPIASGDGVLVSKEDGSSTRAYRFAINDSAQPNLSLSEDGSSTVNVACSAAVGFSDGDPGWLRVTWDASTKDIKFYTSTDGTTWAQLGVTDTLNIASIAATNSRVDIGGRFIGTIGRYSGEYYKVEIYDGIGGTLALSFNADDYLGGTAITSSTTGEVWTPIGAIISNQSSDYSGDDSHARINGTLTATALTAGGVAGLSGWGAGDNIVTDHIAALEAIGAGDIFIKFAFKKNAGASTETIFNLSDPAFSGNRTALLLGSTDYLSVYNNGSLVIQSTSAYGDGLLHTGMYFRKDGISYLEIDGETVASAADTNDLSNPTNIFAIGVNASLGNPFIGSLWLVEVSLSVPTAVERALMHKHMRNLIEGKASLDEIPTSAAYDPIRRAVELVGTTYRQTLQDGAITSSVEHGQGSSAVVAVGPRSEIGVGGSASVEVNVPERNLREKTLTLVSERKTVTYEGDATGSRVLFPDPTNDAEVAEVAGWRPVLVYDDGVEQTKGAADDYTVADYGLGRYCVEFATEPADGNNVDIVFEREVWK